MPLVINSLGVDTQAHTQAYRHHRQKQFQETSGMPALGQCATGLIMYNS